MCKSCYVCYSKISEVIKLIWKAMEMLNGNYKEIYMEAVYNRFSFVYFKNFVFIILRNRVIILWFVKATTKKDGLITHTNQLIFNIIFFNQTKEKPKKNTKQKAIIKVKKKKIKKHIIKYIIKKKSNKK